MTDKTLVQGGSICGDHKEEFHCSCIENPSMSIILLLIATVCIFFSPNNDPGSKNNIHEFKLSVNDWQKSISNFHWQFANA